MPGRQGEGVKPPEGPPGAVVGAVRGNKIEIRVPRGLWAGGAIKDLCPPLFRRLHTRFLEKSKARDSSKSQIP